MSAIRTRLLEIAARLAVAHARPDLNGMIGELTDAELRRINSEEGDEAVMGLVALLRVAAGQGDLPDDETIERWVTRTRRVLLIEELRRAGWVFVRDDYPDVFQPRGQENPVTFLDAEQAPISELSEPARLFYELNRPRPQES